MSFTRQNWLNVFLSHSSEDEGLAINIHNFLKKFGINPILAAYYRQPDEYLSQKIAQLIMDSNCFVVILTRNSINSQWVNQEMGFTHALQRCHELGKISPSPAQFYHHIPIYRLVDASISEHDIKGFFNAKEHIPLDTSNLSHTKYLLLTTLREFINRNEAVIKDVEVVCRKCRYPYKHPLPNQSEINESMSKSFTFVTVCQNPGCRTRNELDPRTFDVVLNT